MKICYPRASKWIEKVPKKAGKCISYIILTFMFCNVVISGFALGRYSERAMGVPAKNEAAHIIDEHFPDERIEQIYPNMKMAE